MTRALSNAFAKGQDCGAKPGMVQISHALQPVQLQVRNRDPVPCSAFAISHCARAWIMTGW